MPRIKQHTRKVTRAKSAYGLVTGLGVDKQVVAKALGMHLTASGGYHYLYDPATGRRGIFTSPRQVSEQLTDELVKHPEILKQLKRKYD